MATLMLRGLVVTTTTGLLVASGAGLASAATTSPTSLSVRLVPHSSTSTVSGTLFSGRTQVSGALVSLVSEAAGSRTWKAVDSERTNDHGLVSFVVTPTGRTRYELRYAATSTYRASHSGVVTAKAPAKAVPSSLSVRANSTSLAKGERTQVSGVLAVKGATLADRKVVLEGRTPGGSWTKERSNQTGAHGRVAFVVSPQANRQFRLFFPGDSVGRASRSGVVTVYVRTATSLSVRESQSSIDPGGSAVVSGVLLSGGKAVAGRTVHLIKRMGSGDWTDVGSQNTGPDGGVSFTVSPDATSQFELVFLRHERYNASRSGVVTLIVRTATALGISTTSSSVTGTLTSGTAALADRTVELLGRTSPDAALASLGAAKTDAGGVATFAVAPSSTTEYQLGFDRTERYLASRSASATITVQPAS